MEAVTADYFRLLGANPVEGRVLSDAENQYPGQSVCLVSAAYASRVFPDRSAVGEIIETDAGALEIIGVLPNWIARWRGADLWVPAALIANYLGPQVLTGPGYKATTVMMLLRDGVSVEAAARALEAVPTRGGSREPVRLVNIEEEIRTPRLKSACLVIASVAVLVLIAAWINVILSWMVQIGRNESVLVVKMMLGATRPVLVLEALIEMSAVVIAATGVALGLVGGALSVIDAFPLKSLSQFPPLSTSASVPAIGLLSLITALLFASALWWNVHTVERRFAGSITGVVLSNRARARHGLIAHQVALAVILVAYAVSAIDRYGELRDTSVGFDSSDLNAFELSVSDNTPRARIRELFVAMHEESLLVPGVADASIASVVPGSDRGFVSSITLEGIGRFLNGGTGPVPGVHQVGPGYFRAIGTSIVRGREFTPLDDASTPRVAIVNEAMAATFWADRDPIGSRLKFGRASEPEPWATIVGVVGNVAHMGVRAEPRPEVYTSVLQDAPRQVFLVTRSHPQVAQAQVTSGVSRVLERWRDDVAVVSERSVEEILYASIQELRYASFFIGTFAFAMAAIGVVGIYTIASLWVKEQEREHAVRAVVGASPLSLAGSALWRISIFGLAGAVIGGAFVAAVSATAESAFYDVPTPGLSEVAVVVVAAAAAVLAFGAVAVRRTLRSDPADHLLLSSGRLTS